MFIRLQGKRIAKVYAICRIIVQCVQSVFIRLWIFCAKIHIFENITWKPKDILYFFFYIITYVFRGILYLKIKFV